jgi:hypothetical protein
MVSALLKAELPLNVWIQVQRFNMLSDATDYKKVALRILILWILR